MTRTIVRGLRQLETRAKEVTAARPEPHTVCFVEPVNKRMTGTFEMATGKWTHYDPPRDGAEFEPMVQRQPVRNYLLDSNNAFFQSSSLTCARRVAVSLGGGHTLIRLRRHP
jgi:hypothetical protein